MFLGKIWLSTNIIFYSWIRGVYAEIDLPSLELPLKKQSTVRTANGHCFSNVPVLDLHLQQTRLSRKIVNQAIFIFSASNFCNILG